MDSRHETAIHRTHPKLRSPAYCSVPGADARAAPRPGAGPRSWRRTRPADAAKAASSRDGRPGEARRWPTTAVCDVQDRTDHQRRAGTDAATGGRRCRARARGRDGEQPLRGECRTPHGAPSKLFGHADARAGGPGAAPASADDGAAGPRPGAAEKTPHQGAAALMQATTQLATPTRPQRRLAAVKALRHRRAGRQPSMLQPLTDNERGLGRADADGALRRHRDGHGSTRPPRRAENLGGCSPACRLGSILLLVALGLRSPTG